MVTPTITMSCNSLPLKIIETSAVSCELDTTNKKFGSGSIKVLQGGYIDVAMPSDFNMLTDSWTVEHWFSITDLETDNYHHLINADKDANGQWAVYVHNTGKLTLNIRGGAANTSTVAVANNEWHHLRVTHTGDKTLKAYLDGNLFATNTFYAAPDSMRIGKTLGESTRWYTGNIDEVALTILDSSNVAEYSGDTAPVPTEGYPDEICPDGGGGEPGDLDGVLTSLDGARDALVTAINAKGGSLADNATLYQCADAVGSLSGGTSTEYYKCASVDTGAKTWSGYKAVFDSSTGMWSFEDTVTAGLAYTSVTPVVGSIYSADALVTVASVYLGYYPTSAPVNPSGSSDGDWVISASSYLDSARHFMYAFYEQIGHDNYCWHSQSGMPQWIQWQNTAQKVLIKSYILTQRDSANFYSSTWTLSGSDDGVNWVELDNVSLDSVGASQATVRNLTSNNTAYYYHRITVTKSDITGTSYATIGRIQAFNYLQ